METDEILDLQSATVFAEWSVHKRFGVRSLARAKTLVDQLAFHERIANVPFLGVVGSKGKGTAALFASAALAATGLRVGTILSPGVISNLDRVCVDGRILDVRDYVAMLQRIRSGMSALDPVGDDHGYLSPGGLFMIAGLDHLAHLEQPVDVIVVEAGMGGTSDEISLFPLETLVVTQIFDEHSAILGPTVSDIAANKIGVASETTREIFALPQTAEVKRALDARTSKLGIAAVTVTAADGADYSDLLPAGLSRLNAIAGVVAGIALGERLTTATMEPAAVRQMLATVRYPGRLSQHRFGSGRQVVDSAISRAGLEVALNFANEAFGTVPDRVVVSLPEDKDFDGFIEVLRDLPTEKIFVALGQTHLHYPSRDRWPWTWIDLPELSARVEVGDSLLVGTISFTSGALEQLGVTTEFLYGHAQG